MNLCKNCGMLHKDCTCRKKEKEKRAPTTNCGKCNAIHRTCYLKSYQGQEICNTCWTIAQIPPADREYQRTLANQFNLKLQDIATHIEAANIKNMTIEDYLRSLPRTREQFVEYFKQGITIGGITL